jgi:aspartate aminotransferase
MEFSQRAQSVTGSITLAIDAQAKRMKAEGQDVVGFGAGEPDFGTPKHIIDAAKAALDAGETRYTPSSGTLKLRQAVCDKLRRDNGLAYEPSQIIVSNGAKHSLYNAFQALLNPGDEVIVPSPYWVSYPELIRMADGVPVYVQAHEEDAFVLKPAALEAAITGRTKALVLNSPSNPCGAVYTRQDLEALAEVIRAHDLCVISDEIYEELIYDGYEHVSIASLPGMQERTMVINGMSKAYAMTGWRIGYAAGPLEWIKVMGNVQSHATSNPNSIAQAAAVAALEGPRDDLDCMRATFDQRRRLLVSGINGIEGLSAELPHGAFYVMVNISGVIGKSCQGRRIEGSMDFTALLLETQKVAVVPGVGFGADQCVRLSYATGEDNIRKGLERIKAFVQSLV